MIFIEDNHYEEANRLGYKFELFICLCATHESIALKVSRPTWGLEPRCKAQKKKISLEVE